MVGEGESGGSEGGLRQSTTAHKRRTGPETPAVRRVGLVSSGLASGAGALGSSRKRVRLGSCSACRRAEEKELPSALCAGGWSGLGCTWWMLGRVGSMLVG